MNDFRYRPAARGIDLRISLRYCLVLVGFLLPCVSSGATSIDICQEPPDQSQLAVAYYDQEAASFEQNRGQTNLNNVNADILFQQNKHWSVAAGYRYTILNVDRLALQTNGHLHTFFFPLHRRSQTDTKGFRFSIAPALSASSNVVTDVDEYTLDAFQLLASAVWNLRLSDRVGMQYGVCGDHRFGKYLVYPVINFNWQISADWTVEFGFPTARISRKMSDKLSTTMRIAPNGNEWFVKDKNLDNESRFVYRAYLFEWEVGWRTHEHLLLMASLGREFHGEYEMTLRDGDRVRLDSDPATRVGVAIIWTF